MNGLPEPFTVKFLRIAWARLLASGSAVGTGLPPRGVTGDCHCTNVPSYSGGSATDLHRVPFVRLQ
jgi:hypothetical protein